jgi:hypothetical protein
MHEERNSFAILILFSRLSLVFCYKNKIKKISSPLSDIVLAQASFSQSFFSDMLFPGAEKLAEKLFSLSLSPALSRSKRRKSARN